MAEEDAETIDSLVTRILHKDEPDAIVIKYAIVIEGMDSEGERFTKVVSPDSARIWDSLQLFEFAILQEHAHYLAHVFWAHQPGGSAD